MEPLERGVVEAAGRAGRVEARLEEGLVDDQIPEPGDLRLVHEPGLQGHTALAEDLPEAGQREADGVGAEPVRRGVEFGAAEAAGVAHPQVSAVGEADDEPVPGLDLPVGGVLQVVDAGGAVDEEPAGHAEPQSEDGSVVAGVERDPLAGAPGGEEVPPYEGVGEDGGRQPALQPPGIGGDHLGDLPFQGPLGELPVRLDLDELGHGGSVSRGW